MLTGYVARNYTLPAGDVTKFLNLIEAMDKHNPDFLWTSYDVGAIWCEEAGDTDTLVQVLLAGLKKYPDAIVSCQMIHSILQMPGLFWGIFIFH